MRASPKMIIATANMPRRMLRHRKRGGGATGSEGDPRNSFMLDPRFFSRAKPSGGGGRCQGGAAGGRNRGAKRSNSTRAPACWALSRWPSSAPFRQKATAADI